MTLTFDWCKPDVNQHDQCHREYKKFLIDPRTNKVVYLDEVVTCQCAKRTCQCYVAAKDRVKVRARKRK